MLSCKIILKRYRLVNKNINSQIWVYKLLVQDTKRYSNKTNKKILLFNILFTQLANDYEQKTAVYVFYNLILKILNKLGIRVFHLSHDVLNFK